MTRRIARQHQRSFELENPAHERWHVGEREAGAAFPHKEGTGFNIDNLYSVGQTRDITVIGFGKSELEDDLRTAAAKQGRVPAQEPSPEKGFYYRSDHLNLAKAGVPMLYTKAGVDSRTQGPDYGKRWLEEYTAKKYHKSADEHSPDWDVSGTLQDLQLYFDVGLGIANSQRWPNWYPGVEFRAIRDASRK